MKKLIIFFPMLILLMQLSGCSEDENSLTAATTRGEGTISFLMNDTLFLPKGRCEIISANFSHILSIEPTNYDTSYNKLDDYIQMNIYVYNKNKNIRLYMTIDSVKEKNMYQIKNATITRLVGIKTLTYELQPSDFAESFVKINHIRIKEYIPSYYQENGNYIEKGQYREGKSTVSGVFELKLRGENGNVIEITKGRFDLKNQSYCKS